MKAVKVLGLVVITALALTTAPSAVAETTALCEVDPGPELNETCPENHLLKVRSFATLSGEPGVVLTSIINVKCNVSYWGETEEPLRNTLNLESAFTYSSCTSGCEVKELNGPGLVKLLKEGHELATVTGAIEVLVKCTGFINCVYDWVGLEGHALGPLLSTLANGDISFSDVSLHKVTSVGMLCPQGAALDLVLHPIEPTYITF